MSIKWVEEIANDLKIIVSTTKLVLISLSTSRILLHYSTYTGIKRIVYWLSSAVFTKVIFLLLS